MYPASDYKSVFVDDIEDYDRLSINETINLSYKECLEDKTEGIFLCLDSIVGDSRCPVGVMCFWEGNAEVRFTFGKYNDKSVTFSLNTSGIFRRDTILSGYKISLTELSPYPVFGHRIDQKDYRAGVLVKKE
jgi:hypothetical protein